MDRRTLYIFTALLLWAGVSMAESFWFSQKAGAGSDAALADDLIFNNGQAITNLNAAELTCSRTNVGDALVYSIAWAGSDFDGDAVNDTLSFELWVEGFEGSIYTYSANDLESSMTALGASSDVTTIDNTWGVGGDFDVDAGQSLRFSITNVQVSVPGCIGGLTDVRVMEPNGGREHLLVLGEGTGLVGLDFSAATAALTFSATNQFIITGAGSYYPGSAEWAVSSIGFKFSVSDSPVWDVSDYSEFVTGPGYGDEYSAQESLSNYPEFSWDTVPRWLIIRKSSAYTETDIQTMANNYEVIVLEKANTAGFDTTEAGTLDTAARIRAVDPTTKNLFYWNSYINYGGYEANALYEPHDWEWSNHTLDTNEDESIYLLRDKYSTYNYSVPEMRDWWVNAALGMVSNSAIDGVFIDKSHDLDDRAWLLGPDVSWVVDAVPASDYLSMMMALDEGLPEGKLHTGNTLRNEKFNGNRPYMEIMEGSYLERWDMPDGDSTPAQGKADATAVSLQLMREALAKGKIIMFKTDGDHTSASSLASTVDYPLALFLIVAETNAYFSYQGSVDATHDDWQWDTSNLPEFNRPLGPPLGDPIRNGYVYTRSYEHVDVWVDISTGETRFAWDSVDTDGDGMSDLWELRNFGGTTHAVATDNPDGDAYTNLEEYTAGLDPNVFDTFAVTWDGGGNGVNWGDEDNWDPVRVPGALVVGSGVIGNGGSVAVATNFTGTYVYDVIVTNSSTLNIAADLQNVGVMNVGTVVDQAATVNQTAGAVTSASLNISVAGNSADAVYTLTDGSHDVSGNATVESNGVLNVDGGSLDAVLSVIVADGAVLRQTGGDVAAGSGMGTGNGFVIRSGGLIEISGGTFRNNARISFASGGIFRIIGDEASVSQNQLAAGNQGTYEFVLNETGVSTLEITSWAKLANCNFVIDGSAYTGGTSNILLFSAGNIAGISELGANYSVTGLGDEGGDWTITESTDPHTVTLNILGLVEIGDITMGGVNAASDLVISWYTVDGQSYNVETNADLTVPSGWGVSDTIVGDGNPVSVTNTPVGPQLFYKVISE